jgi:hypothetical protein
LCLPQQHHHEVHTHLAISQHQQANTPALLLQRAGSHHLLLPAQAHSPLAPTYLPASCLP